MSIADRLRTLLGQGAPEVSGSPLPGPSAVTPIDRRARKRVNARRGTSVLIIDDSKTIVVALRRMLELRHRTCVEPGCDVPGEWWAHPYGDDRLRAGAGAVTR